MKQAVFLLPLLTAALPALTAHADIQYVETMSMGNTGMAMTSTHWMKTGMTRTDTAMNLGPMKMGSVIIDRCAEGKMFTVAPDLKLFATASPSAMMPRGMTGRNTAAPATEKGTGTSSLEFTSQDLGSEKIAGVDTHHYAVAMTVTNTGCAGNGTHSTKLEVWTADIKLPSCPAKTTPTGTGGPAGAPAGGCDIKTQIKGDTTVMAKAFGGLMMKMKMESNGQVITKEITSLSQAPIADDVFQVPADFKEVTPMELGQAQGRAMMSKMMAGGGGDMSALANMGSMMKNMPAGGGSMGGMNGDPLGGFLGDGLKSALQNAGAGN